MSDEYYDLMEESKCATCSVFLESDAILPLDCEGCDKDGEWEVLKVARSLDQVKEVVENKFTPLELDKADRVLRRKAVKCKIPYVTLLRVIAKDEDFTAKARLLAMYLLYLL